MILEMHIEENIHNSEVIIYDCSNLTFNHIIKFTPSVLKKADTILVCKNYFTTYIIYTL